MNIKDNKKPISLLALDLDGTTLTSQNTLSEKTKSAVIMAIKNGIKVVAASGRPYGTMPDSVLEIDGIDYAITSNGAAVYDKNKNCIYRSLMNEKDVLKLLKITEPYDFIFEAFVEGLTYTDKRYTDNPIAYGCGEAYVDYVRSAHGHIENMRDFIFEHRKELDSIEIVCPDKSMRRMIWQKAEKYTENVYITSSSENFVEFMNGKATKSNALKWLCKYLVVDLSEACACGNADNDADMIAEAGLGAAVKNASHMCLKNADLIVASNDDDGVAELIDIILSCNANL